MIIYNISKNFEEVKEYDLDKYLYWFILNDDELYDLPFDIDSECIQECKFYNSFSQINFYDKYTFMILSVLEFCDEMLVSKEIDIFFGKRFIITIYKGNADIISSLIDDLNDNKNCFIVKNTPKISTFLYILIDRIVLRNYYVINSLNSRGDKIEISILKEASRRNSQELINLRGEVYRVKKYLNPLRYIGDSLRLNENKILDDEDMCLFESIDNKFQKLMISVENLNQQLSVVREAYESEISNKTNELMKVFTLVAAIFLPLDLLTSFFGMSFENIPFRTCFYSVHIIFGIMIIIISILLIIFKRNDWL